MSVAVVGIVAIILVIGTMLGVLLIVLIEIKGRERVDRLKREEAQAEARKTPLQREAEARRRAIEEEAKRRAHGILGY